MWLTDMELYLRHFCSYVYELIEENLFGRVVSINLQYALCSFDSFIDFRRKARKTWLAHI